MGSKDETNAFFRAEVRCLSDHILITERSNDLFSIFFVFFKDVY